MNCTLWFKGFFQGQDLVSQEILCFPVQLTFTPTSWKTNVSNKAFRFNLLSASSLRNLWRSLTACSTTPTGRSNEKVLVWKLTVPLLSSLNVNIISKFIDTNLYDSKDFYLDLWLWRTFKCMDLCLLSGWINASYWACWRNCALPTKVLCKSGKTTLSLHV